MPRWAVAIGSFGYIGFVPVAPGTVASAVAVVLYYFLPFLQRNLILIGVSLVLVIVGWKATAVILRSSQVSDPSFVVFDEVVGQWIALLSPIHQGNLTFILLSFVLFRFFDILKPFPASYFDRNSGAVHVLMDDVVAAIYANLAAHLILWFISSIWSI